MSVVGLLFASALISLFVCSVAHAQNQAEQAKPSFDPDAGGARWAAFLSAAISVGFGCVGAGLAVAHVGAAAVGAVAEKPQVAVRTLIFVGLAEGIAIYGLIVAIMMLGKI